MKVDLVADPEDSGWTTDCPKIWRTDDGRFWLQWGQALGRAARRASGARPRLRC
jgi:hypothetical protein